MAERPELSRSRNRDRRAPAELRQLRRNAARGDRRGSLEGEFDAANLRDDDDDEWKKVNRRIKREGERLPDLEDAGTDRLSALRLSVFRSWKQKAMTGQVPSGR
jgi:hypothetical protein